MSIRLMLINLLLAILLIPSSAHAQVEQVKTIVEFEFGESIYFYGQVQSKIPVEAAVLFFEAGQGAGTQIGLAQVNPMGNGRYDLIYVHRISDHSIRPFSTIYFHWELILSDGQIYESALEQDLYMDNRFDWKTLEGKHYRVHWYQGDLQLAQDILNAAENGASRIEELLRLPSPEMLDIYVYHDADSMQATLSEFTQDWVAGHADPDLGVILVALPEGPEQSLLIEQRIPHELMHILIYQFIPVGYKNLPAWLSEGLASQAELYPNPDYRILLEEAAQRNTLLPISELCYTFPREAYKALLSYAESASFVRYLQNTYGASEMRTLLNAYANGLDCNRGVESTFGKDLARLEKEWLQTELSQNVALKTLMSLLPWIVLSLAVLAAPLTLSFWHLWSKSGRRNAKELEGRIQKSTPLQER